MERTLLTFLPLLLLVSVARASQWPVPYKRYDSRPQANPFCKAQYTFCPTGFKAGYIPPMDSKDTIEVFVLKAPVWEFRFGDLLAKFNIIHDAIGFRSKLTGRNYTTEWYELFQLFNCTFPHEVATQSAPLWCNQGAACFYPGIDDLHWKQNGTLEKVTELTGDQFNKLAQYILWDNRTGLFYETWRVRNSMDVNYVQWFNPFDCASYVIRVFQKMGDLGANFTNHHANYTFITLYSDTPQLLGNASTIFSEKGNKSIASDLTEFYSYFQAHQSAVHFVESLLEIYNYIFLKNKFYLFYNSEYWFLPMKTPHVKLTFEYVPFKNITNYLN